MTRKRIGAGLLEVFSESCDHCNGRGVVINMDGSTNKGRGKNRNVEPGHEHHTHDSAVADNQSEFQAENGLNEPIEA
jgi:ribonuclease E